MSSSTSRIALGGLVLLAVLLVGTLAGWTAAVRLRPADTDTTTTEATEDTEDTTDAQAAEDLDAEDTDALAGAEATDADALASPRR